MRQCPRCASEIGDKDKVCSRCGLPVSDVVESEDSLPEELEKQAENKMLNAAQRKEKKRLAKKERKEEKRKKKIEEKTSTTDFSKFASNGEMENQPVDGRLRRKKRKGESFNFEVDENGEFNIDTTDVEIIGEEISKAYDQKREQQSYSIKKARGDYRAPKIKWWEIYKIADRTFARKKIKKEISKAGKVKPDFVSKPKLLLLAILFGWCGAHNFYARNKKKGFVSLSFLFLSIIGMALNEVPFFKAIELWIIGFSGFVVLFIWLCDIIDIIFNRFQYKAQRDKFIAGMNIETRAKLGEKYIDLELLHKPFHVRFKVWCDKKKKNYYERKREKRQAMIEREKAKLEKNQEKEAINNEIAKAEEKELEIIKNQKAKEKQKRMGKGSSKLVVAEKKEQSDGQALQVNKKVAKVTVNKKNMKKNSTKKK